MQSHSDTVTSKWRVDQRMFLATPIIRLASGIELVKLCRRAKYRAHPKEVEAPWIFNNHVSLKY